MQIRPAGQHRQGLVRGIAAEVRAEIHRVTGWREKAQIGPVGVVHQQQGPVGVTDFGQRRKPRQEAQIVRAGQIDRVRSAFRERSVQKLRRGLRGEIRILRGREPDNVQIEQRRRRQERLVTVPGSKDAETVPILSS